MSTIDLTPANTDDYIVDRLSNVNSVAEGGVLPPTLRGGSRIPSVSNVQVANKTAQADSTKYTITWNDASTDPTLIVDHYNVYYSLGSETTQLVGPFVSLSSPATVIAHTTAITTVTFYVQTVLGNGMTSSLSHASTAASTTLPNYVNGLSVDIPVLLNGPGGSLLISGVTWTNNSPVGTSVAWSAGKISYKAVGYDLAAGNSGAGNTWIYWSLATPTVFHSSATYPTLGTDDFVVGINNSFGAAGTQGYFSQVLELHDAQAERTYIIPDALVMYNAEGKLVSSYARTSTDSGGAPAAAVLRMADGTGAGSLGQGQRIILTGSDGKIQMGTFEVERNNASVDMSFKHCTGSPGAGLGDANAIQYLKVIVDGSTRYIPLTA